MTIKQLVVKLINVNDVPVFHIIRMSIALYIIFLASVSYSEEYIIVKGSGIDVCDAYVKNINAYNIKHPVMAGLGYRSLDPEIKDFRNPNWELVYGSGMNRFPKESDILIRISKFIWERDANPVDYVKISDWSKWRGTKKQRTGAYQAYLYERHESGKMRRGHLIAEIDIDNDGKTEPVYLDKLYQTSNAGLLIVLTHDYKDIDYEKTKLVQMHPSRKEAGWDDLRNLSPEVRKEYLELKNITKISTGSALSLSYSVFIYKNKTYFDLWGDSGPYEFENYYPFDNYLRVFVVEDKTTTEICRYKYTNK